MTPAEETRLRSWLVCRVERRLCALSLADVVETMRPLPIEPVAGAPAFVVGLALVRGEPVPVVDTRRLMGGDPGVPGRFVTLRVGPSGAHGPRAVALAVDAVLDVRAIAPAALRAMPPLLTDAGANVIAAIGRLDADLLLVLDGAHLLPEVEA